MTVHLLHGADGARHGFVPKKIVNFRLAHDAAMLRGAGVETVILNGQLAARAVPDTALEAMRPGDLLVLPLLDGTTCAPSLEWAVRAKARTGVRMVVCGELATFAATEILAMFPQVDVLIRGEEELELCRLATGARQRAGIVTAEPVLPSRWKLPESGVWGRYAVAQSSRGCAYRCTFCSVNAFSDPDRARADWRGLSAGQLQRWLQELADRGVTFVELADADVLGTTREGLDRARDLVRRGPAPVGLMVATRADTIVDHPGLVAELVGYGVTRWQVGVESADEATLRRFKKGLVPEVSLRAVRQLADLGAMVRMEFIMFEPDSTPRTLRANLDMLAEFRDMGVSIQRALFNRLRVGRWSPAIVRRLVDEGRLRRHIFPLFDFTDNDPDVAEVFAGCAAAHSAELVKAEMIGLLLERLIDVGAGKAATAVTVAALAHRLDTLLWDLVDHLLTERTATSPTARRPSSPSMAGWLATATALLDDIDVDACFPGTRAWLDSMLDRVPADAGIAGATPWR